MTVMILISSTAILVGIVGCLVIWGLDAVRADEIERPKPALVVVPVLPAAAAPQAIDPS